MSVIDAICFVALAFCFIGVALGGRFTLLSLGRLRARVRLLEDRLAAVEDRQHREWDR